MPIKHTVAAGECISSIAESYGFFPDTVWSHADNSALKSKRKDPNTLLAGDVVAIPDKTLKEESLAPEQRHKFKRKGVPEKLKLQLKDGDKPRANLAYTLDIDGKLVKGKTDVQGKIEASIPPGARQARLILGPNESYELELGDLDPVTEVSGVQGRLRNLGYYTGPVDGLKNDLLTEAVREFQMAQDPDQPASGELDDATRAQLTKAYGG